MLIVGGKRSRLDESSHDESSQTDESPGPRVHPSQRKWLTIEQGARNIKYRWQKDAEAKARAAAAKRRKLQQEDAAAADEDMAEYLQYKQQKKAEKEKKLREIAQREPALLDLLQQEW